jgi:hypothetical protein
LSEGEGPQAARDEYARLFDDDGGRRDDKRGFDRDSSEREDETE